MDKKNIISHILIVGITSGAILAGLTGKTIWPFSSYAVYSWKPGATNYVYLFQVTDQLGRTELIEDQGILWPVGNNGMRTKIETVLDSENKKQDLQEILKFYLGRYVRKVKPNLHFGTAQKIVLNKYYLKAGKSVSSRFDKTNFETISRFEYE